MDQGSLHICGQNAGEGTVAAPVWTLDSKIGLSYRRGQYGNELSPHTIHNDFVADSASGTLPVQNALGRRKAGLKSAEFEETFKVPRVMFARVPTMRIKIGYDLSYRHFQPTPVILMTEVHQSRVDDLERLDIPQSEPSVPIDRYFDGFGNRCCRLVAPSGDLRIFAETIIKDSGQPDPVVPDAVQHQIQDLPYETLGYLLGSRYCETQLLSEDAWRLFGHTPLGWARVQAVCDFVQGHLQFDYQLARNTRTAAEAYRGRVGVCRDFAHLAIAFCRCLNIPARYCTGYLGDIGVPPVPDPMDFSGWFEAFLGGQWRTFDARHNKPRIGRIPIAYGRDAGDVAISTAFGPEALLSFRVLTFAVKCQW